MRSYLLGGVAALLFAISALAQTSPAASNPGNVPVLPSGVPENAAMYAVRMAGQDAGQLAVWNEADGKRHWFFQFNDRGRGPKSTSVAVIGRDACPSLLVMHGVDYLKKPADEDFSVSAKVAQWKNAAEQGRKPLSAPAFYVPYNGTPEDTALLVRALLANGGKIHLLPAGEARLTRLGERPLHSGQRTEMVTQYAVSGLDYTPTYVWLDAKHELFAQGGSWLMTVRKGWEDAVPTILEAQSEADEVGAADLARRLTHHPNGPLVIYNANLFDSETAKVVPRQTVVIQGGRIASVAPSQPEDARRAGAEVIDATGKMLLPGLWDMHVHLGNADGLLHMAAGVTTVRDLGNDIDENNARIARFNAGTEIGPRVIPAGIIDGPGPFQGPTKVLVATPAEAVAAVDNYHRLGYPQIKIYSSVKPELVPVIVAEAHKNGQRVSGHIPAGMIAEDAVRDGYNEIQHINFVVLNFFPEVKDKTQTRARLMVPGERAADLDLNSEPVRNFLRLLKEKHVDVDPTLVAFEGMYGDEAGKISPAWQPIADRLPAQARRGLLAGGAAPAGQEARFRASFAKMLQLTEALYDDGIPIDAGTDGFSGFALHRELELLHEAGIPAPQVLQIATLGSARIMSQDGNRGSIKPGKLADLIVVNGDPAANISDIRKVETVIKGGDIYYPRELYPALGIKPE